MARSGIRLSSQHQIWLYVIFGILFLSGILWIAFHYYFSGPSLFAATQSPIELWSLKVHGGAAMAFLLVLGSLIPEHMRGGWLARKNLRSGIMLVSFNLVLILSAYGLYYVGDETLRNSSSLIHIFFGISVAPILFWHVWKRPRS